MPSLGSLFSAIGRMLPGFVEGERMAVKDNWDDLKNYNDVQSGQLENAWTEATWNPRLANVWFNALNNAFAVEESRRNNALRWQEFPGLMDAAATRAKYGGDVQAAQLRQALGPNYKYDPQRASYDIGDYWDLLGGNPFLARPRQVDQQGNGQVQPVNGTNRPSGVGG